MTKEELVNEAEEKYREVDREFMDCQDEGEIFNLGYLAGAEPREKRIAELEQEVLEVRQHLDLTEGEWGKDLYKQIHFKNQLTKAKEIIKKFSEFVNNEVEYDPEHPQEHTDLWNKLCEEAGQFLSEVDK